MNEFGPQKQPASEVCECCESTHDVRDANRNMLCAMCRGSEYDELARLRAENERLQQCLTDAAYDPLIPFREVVKELDRLCAENERLSAELNELKRQHIGCYDAMHRAWHDGYKIGLNQDVDDT